MPTSTAVATLHKYFGFESFRPGQAEIVTAIIEGHDVLAILPTGGGKSLCFQVPGLILGGTTIVLSPLISLMKDQVDHLLKKGISATYINSSLSKTEQQQRLRLARESHFSFIYLSPERLASREIKDLLSQIHIPLVVIDEAHCISEWGHDFRPEYRCIASHVALISPRPCIAAFTATATPTVKNDITQSLQLTEPKRFEHSTVRTNLTLHSYHCATNTAQTLALMRILKHHQGEAGIIYAATREHTKILANQLSSWLPRPVVFYHGGLPTSDRAAIQQTFISGTTPVIVATNAFGMGVDKPDIRFVVHYHLPGSIEQYSQEVGRAGRDRAPAAGYLLFNPANTQIQATLALRQNSQKATELQLTKLQQMVALAQTNSCIHAHLASYFGENTTACSSLCSSCLQEDWTHPLLVGMNDISERVRLERLLSVRKNTATKLGCHVLDVAQDISLCLLALYHPTTVEECHAIPGIGTGWIAEWWEYFAQAVTPASRHPPLLTRSIRTTLPP